MAATATVTAKVADLSANYRPDWQPMVLISPSKATVALDGTVIPSEPVMMEDDGNGNLSVELVVTSELQENVTYTAVVDWLSLTGETALRERLPNFIVPDAGGTLGDLALVETVFGLAWQGKTPPTQSMLWLYVDPDYDPDSGDPLPTYSAPNGTIEHGELVDWEA
jgi:hypothetical protein